MVDVAIEDLAHAIEVRVGIVAGPHLVDRQVERLGRQSPPDRHTGRHVGRPILRSGRKAFGAGAPKPDAAMTNEKIAQRLAEIAALMEFDEEPFFKIKAYQRAARSVEDAREPMRSMIDSGSLEELPGVGKAIAQK